MAVDCTGCTKCQTGPEGRYCADNIVFSQMDECQMHSKFFKPKVAAEPKDRPQYLWLNQQPETTSQVQRA